MNQTPNYSDKLENAIDAVLELCDKWDTKGSYCLPIEDVVNVIKRELK